MSWIQQHKNEFQTFQNQFWILVAIISQQVVVVVVVVVVEEVVEKNMGPLMVSFCHLFLSYSLYCDWL